MKFVAVYAGEQITMDVIKKNGQYVVTLKDRCVIVDAIRPSTHSLSLLVDGVSYEVALEKRDAAYSVYFYNDTLNLEIYEARKFKAAEVAKKTVQHGPVKVIAPMPGKLLRVLVEQNAQVNEGDPLLIIEAMKMQNELKSPKTGIVAQIHVKEGTAVGPQQILMIIE
jgi:biotin carboxyl carrier protein